MKFPCSLLKPFLRSSPSMLSLNIWSVILCDLLFARDLSCSSLFLYLLNYTKFVILRILGILVSFWPLYRSELLRNSPLPSRSSKNLYIEKRLHWGEEVLDTTYPWRDQREAKVVYLKKVRLSLKVVRMPRPIPSHTTRMMFSSSFCLLLLPCNNRSYDFCPIFRQGATPVNQAKELHQPLSRWMISLHRVLRLLILLICPGL